MTTATLPRRFEIRSAATAQDAVSNLAPELARLWAQVTAEIEAAAGHPPVHTNVLTLLVVAQGSAEIRMARQVLHQLAENLPSRAVVVEIVRPGGELGAQLSAHCVVTDPALPTCYDVIEVRAPRDQIDALPSLLEPIQLPDVPLFLWWVGEVEFGGDDFNRMMTLAERVMIDSSAFEDVAGALLAYARHLEATAATCTTTDLNWARSTSWRELIAQSFDNPMTRSLLGAIQHIEIDYDPEGESQALLLTGWLGSRLGWTPKAATRGHATTSLVARGANGGEIYIDLNRQSSAGVGLRAVRLLATRGQESVRITVRRRSEELAAVAIELPGMPRQERVVHDARPRLADLVGSELLIRTRERVFEDALGCAAEFLTMLEGTHGPNDR